MKCPLDDGERVQLFNAVLVRGNPLRTILISVFIRVCMHLMNLIEMPVTESERKKWCQAIESEVRTHAFTYLKLRCVRIPNAANYTRSVTTTPSNYAALDLGEDGRVKTALQEKVSVAWLARRSGLLLAR